MHVLDLMFIIGFVTATYAVGGLFGAGIGLIVGALVLAWGARMEGSD